MATPEEDGWRGAGFSVDPASFAGVAGQLGKSFDDFNAAIALADGSERHAPDDFNSYVSKAWSAFNVAWKTEMDITSEAIKELIEKTHPTIKNYSTADSFSESAVNAVEEMLRGLI